VAAEANVYITK